MWCKENEDEIINELENLADPIIIVLLSTFYFVVLALPGMILMYYSYHAVCNVDKV